MRRQAALLAVVASLSGCSFFKTEVGTPVPEAPPPYVVGATSMAEVLRDLGPPFELTATPGGVAFLYQEATARETQIGVGGGVFSGIAYLSLFKLVYAFGSADRRALLLAFDQDGVLSAQAHDAWTEDLGTGSAIELIFNAVPLVDTSRLEEEPPAATWPQGLLKALPETLNSGQSLDSGQTGLEQLSTPTRVGQHTLEMR